MKTAAHSSEQGTISSGRTTTFVVVYVFPCPKARYNDAPSTGRSAPRWNRRHTMRAPCVPSTSLWARCRRVIGSTRNAAVVARTDCNSRGYRRSSALADAAATILAELLRYRTSGHLNRIGAKSPIEAKPYPHETGGTVISALLGQRRS